MSRAKRIFSLLVDLKALFIAGLVLLFVYTMILSSEDFEAVDTPKPFGWFVFGGIVFLLLVKDILGRSFGKYGADLVIVDHQSGRLAHPVQCIVRNLTLIIWPVELLILLVHPERRLGDLLAGTKVIFAVQKDLPMDYSNARVRWVGASLLITFAAVYFTFNHFQQKADARNYAYKSHVDALLSQHLDEIFKQESDWRIKKIIPKVYEPENGVRRFTLFVEVAYERFMDMKSNPDFEQLNADIRSKLDAVFGAGAYEGVIKFGFRDSSTKMTVSKRIQHNISAQE